MHFKEVKWFVQSQTASKYQGQGLNLHLSASNSSCISSLILRPFYFHEEGEPKTCPSPSWASFHAFRDIWSRADKSSLFHPGNVGGQLGAEAAYWAETLTDDSFSWAWGSRTKPRGTRPGETPGTLQLWDWRGEGFRGKTTLLVLSPLVSKEVVPSQTHLTASGHFQRT